VLIHPRGTGDAEQRARQLRDELADRAPGRPGQPQPTLMFFA
jgi:hypothetical protein